MTAGLCPTGSGYALRHEIASHPESASTDLALARRTADRAIVSGRLRPQDATQLLDVLSQLQDAIR